MVAQGSQITNRITQTQCRAHYASQTNQSKGIRVFKVFAVFAHFWDIQNETKCYCLATLLPKAFIKEQYIER